jgi:hypothetical protein
VDEDVVAVRAHERRVAEGAEALDEEVERGGGGNQQSSAERYARRAQLPIVHGEHTVETAAEEVSDEDDVVGRAVSRRSPRGPEAHVASLP